VIGRLSFSSEHYIIIYMKTTTSMTTTSTTTATRTRSAATAQEGILIARPEGELVDPCFKFPTSIYFTARTKVLLLLHQQIVDARSSPI